jgi:hypothetical protein
MPPTKKTPLPRPSKKMFGKSVFWQSDSGLGFWYGQVFQPVSQKLGGGASSVTCRARIDVTEGW